MTLGLVSNCWQSQLGAGVDLIDCIADAHARGYRWIELRQTCLGRFEEGDPPRPDAGALAELPRQFPGTGFNIAIDVTFLQAGGLNDNAVIQAGTSAAQAAAGEHRPHLRLVDLATREPDRRQTEAIAHSLVMLAESMRERGGLLSVEQSIQSWGSFREVFDAARQRLGGNGDCLRLCYDPVNLLNGDGAVDPVAVTRSLSAAEMSMVHIKQRRDGAILPCIADGDVDWRDLLSALKSLCYDGPFLYEVAPSPGIWEELEVSTARLNALGFAPRT